jgi:hypothetical protein
VTEAVLTLLGKPDCHLCHEMRAVVERVLAGRDVGLVWRDVRDDPEWKRRYLLDIPVLLWGDREVARHRVSPDELAARLAALGLPNP